MTVPSRRGSTIRPCVPEDAAGCLDIYSPIVRESATSFEYELPTVAEFARRIRQTTRNYPWLVAETAEDPPRLAGFAYGRGHRERPAYQWSVEVSVYVAQGHRRRGVGRALYAELLHILKRQGYYNAYAIIALPNEASVSFHESMGFEPAGVYSRAGFKLGRWHDVGWWALRLGDCDGQPPAPIPFSHLPP